jgi:hypothetical protein
MTPVIASIDDPPHDVGQGGTIMEPHPGVFVAKSSTDDWKLDPGVPGSQMHELVHADGLWAGFTRFTDVDGPLTWTPEQREVALVLEGSVRIEVTGGGTLDPFGVLLAVTIISLQAWFYNQQTAIRQANMRSVLRQRLLQRAATKPGLASLCLKLTQFGSARETTSNATSQAGKVRERSSTRTQILLVDLRVDDAVETDVR